MSISLRKKGSPENGEKHQVRRVARTRNLQMRQNQAAQKQKKGDRRKDQTASQAQVANATVQDWSG